MNSNNKLANRISIFFIIILLLTGILSISSGQLKNLFISILAIACIISIFVVDHFAKSKKILLPSSFTLVTICFIFMTLFCGEILGFYIKFWWWDLLLHFIAGVYLTIVAMSLMKGIITLDKSTTIKRFTFLTIILAFSFSITLGTLWEIFEFAGDYFFNTTMVDGGFEDTISDLVVKISGAFITSLINYFSKSK